MSDDLGNSKRPGVVYIAGPMSGYRYFNYPAFYRAEIYLTGEGWENIINPARNFGGYTGLTKATYLRQAIKQVAASDAIFLLRGWEHSQGAVLEAYIASELRLTIIDKFVPTVWNEPLDPEAQVQ